MGVMTAREFYLNKSKILARVEAGETIDVTKHGRPVARVTPVDAPSTPRPERGTPEWQAAYDRMVRTMDENSFNWGGRVNYADKHE